MKGSLGGVVGGLSFLIGSVVSILRSVFGLLRAAEIKTNKEYGTFHRMGSKALDAGVRRTSVNSLNH